MMRGIIIDGVASAGKTSVLKILQQKILEDRSSSSNLFISEHYTQRMLEHLAESKSITGSVVRHHLSCIVQTLQVYQDMLGTSKFASNPGRAEIFVTLERFLLTYFATYPDIVEDFGYEEATEQFRFLHQLQLKQCIFTLSPEHIKRNIAFTLTHRNQEWLAYIASRGGVDVVVGECVEWQANLLHFTKRFSASIDTEIMNMDEGNYSEVASHIFYTIYVK